MPEVVDADISLLTARARTVADGTGRVIIGIAGSPGSGKTTLAAALVDALNAGGTSWAASVTMDGFHLANATLDRLGRRSRKGAIDTFDGWGFVALVRRLRTEVDHDVYAPSFRRDVDEPIAGELVVPAGTRIVLVEGNYLLVDESPWRDLRGLMDEAWYCQVDDAERVERLVVRHHTHGRSLAAARDWALTVDGANARLIENYRDRADLMVLTTAN
jgi:pantothenate kinase